jgi:N-acyl homoserine lactone hydrolase
VAHAVAHRDGVFLFDTGIGTGNPEIDELIAERHPIQQVLASHDIAMTDITAVANCHLHVDHAGQNVSFTGRPIFVQRREWAMVREPDYTIPEWVDAPGLSYEVVDGDVEVAPGLRLITSPGHAPGHQSLVVETSQGAVLIAGQAIQTVAEWEGSTDELYSGEPPEGDDRRDDYRASAKRLHDLGAIRVHFVHDPTIWERERS